MMLLLQLVRRVTLQLVIIYAMKEILFFCCLVGDITIWFVMWQALAKDVEQHSGSVGDVLNHCELLLNDCDSAHAQLNTDGIATAMTLIEKRYGCVHQSTMRFYNKRFSYSCQLLLVNIEWIIFFWLTIINRQFLTTHFCLFHYGEKIPNFANLLTQLC